MKAIHHVLFLLRSQTEFLSKFRLKDYMKPLREVAKELINGMQCSTAKDTTIEYLFE